MTIAVRTVLDVAGIRERVPALAYGAAHFDAPGGTQTPDVVAAAIGAALTAPLANRGTSTVAERNAESIVAECRRAVGDLLGVDAGTVVFGRSTTALTFDLSRAIAADWREGDEIVLTRLDHDANVRPWELAAERRGVTVRWAEFDPETAELPVEAVAGLLTERTRLVAVTAASNLLGTMPDIAAIADRVHDVGALLYVDGVHYAAHAFVDVPALGADFFACSPYKFLGPHCGVVTGRADLLDRLTPDKLTPSPDRTPERFELGTLPYELMAGTTAAIDFLASFAGGDGSRRELLRASADLVTAHEHALRGRIEDAAAAWPGVRVLSRARRRTPTLLLALDDPAALATHLAERSVNAPAGSFYAHRAAESLGLGSAGGVRVGLAPYNDDSDVDRLIDGVESYVASR